MSDKTLRVEVVSPEGSIYSGEAKMFFAKGAEGDLGIAPGHLQLLTSIAPGTVRIQQPDGKEEWLFVSGGILEVQPYQVSILADTVERPKDVNETAAKEAKAAAEKLLKDRKAGTPEFAKAQHDLAEAMAKLRLVEILRAQRKH